MSSNAKASFGVRIRNARMLSNLINHLPDYVANNDKERQQDFAEFVDELEKINVEEASTASIYHTAVADRKAIYSKSEGSIFVLVGKIKKVVSIKYGKSSEQMKQISALVKSMTNSKPARKKDATDPTKINKVSQSQKSFGSSIQFFRDIISTLISFGDYTTSIAGLNIEDLQKVATNVDKLNRKVDKSALANKQAKEKRMKMYAQLAISANNIRNCIGLVYGTSSVWYQDIKKLAF